MSKPYVFVAMITSAFLLISYSIDPPNGKTGAPGESNCAECHKPQSQTIGGTISIEGFPETITPDETYDLTVVNRNTIGDAVRGGFQMTVLGPLNTKAGELSSPLPANGCTIQSSGGRQYFEHHPAAVYPDSNVVKWYVKWKASSLPASGKVTAYVAGNITNGNFQSSGDHVVTATASGNIILAAIPEIAASPLVLYPNPGQDEIHISFENAGRPDGRCYFYNSNGQLVASDPLNQGLVNVTSLTAGLYWIKIVSGPNAFFGKWIKV
ncbi:MAG TPA: choice-of-anchor V domain-containing protein [Saprospiraceae bacterium]|nr:choice-of-anchor V domain-containing protein [Saprospiraceae bacterium]